MNFSIKQNKIIIIILILFCLFNRNSLASSKKSIAVLDFTSNNIAKSYAKIVRNKIELMLYKSKKYDLLERNMVQLLIKEQIPDKQNCDKLTCAISIGQIVSADYIVYGSLDSIEEFVITIRVIDVKRRKIIFADSINCSNKDQILNAAENIGKKTRITVDKLISKDRQFVEKELVINENIDTIKNEQNKKKVVSKNTIKKKPLKFHFSLTPGVAIPVGKFSEIVNAGYGLPILLGAEHTKYNFIIAFETAFYHLMDINQNTHAMIIPFMLSLQYFFKIKNFIFLSPYFSAGASLNLLLREYSQRKAIEPVIKAGGKFGFIIKSKYKIFIGLDYFNIFEESGSIGFLNINIGFSVYI